MILSRKKNKILSKIINFLLGTEKKVINLDRTSIDPKNEQNKDHRRTQSADNNRIDKIDRTILIIEIYRRKCFRNETTFKFHLEQILITNN